MDDATEVQKTEVQKDHLYKDGTLFVNAGKYGRAIPIQLVLALQEELLQKATEWMRENDVPDEVVQAVNDADYLHLIARYIEAGKLSDMDAGSLLEVIIEASNISVKFGGEFFGEIIGDSQIPSMKS